MIEGGAALLRLLSWLSPAFPVGSFAYSHGLEQAIHEGLVRDRATLCDWLEFLLERGSGWNDAVLMAAGWREAAGGGDGRESAELGAALAGSRERHLETMLQGSAFRDAVAPWVPGLGDFEMPYPVAVGMAAARGGVGLDAALLAFTHAFGSNLVQGAVRLVPLGQRDGVAAIASLESVLQRVSRRAALSSPDDLGGCAFVSDIMSMRHEALYSRVFRS